MVPDKQYAVNEIFYSLQGEGWHTGTPAVFLRFSGCNRRCPFCDTDFSHATMMDAREIACACAAFPARHLVVTGGEPLLQLDSALLRVLKASGFLCRWRQTAHCPCRPRWTGSHALPKSRHMPSTVSTSSKSFFRTRMWRVWQDCSRLRGGSSSHVPVQMWKKR